MTIKERLKRDIRVFEYKMGLNNNDTHSYNETAKKFRLSRPQTIRNVRTVGIRITEAIELKDHKRLESLFNYPEESLIKIYNAYIEAFRRVYG